MKDCYDGGACGNEQYIEDLESVFRAAAVILKAIKNRPMMFKKESELCPHGNMATQPWFCDDCFLKLEEALRKVEEYRHD